MINKNQIQKEREKKKKMVMKACRRNYYFGRLSDGICKIFVGRNMFLMDNLFDFEYVIDECY